MKKLLFVVIGLIGLFLLYDLITGAITYNKTYKSIQYGSDKSKDSLYLEAKDMTGIGILEILDTKDNIVKKLKKHNAKYRHKFNGSTAHFGDEYISWNNTLPHLSYNGDCYEVSYIVDADMCIDFELRFYRDSLYEIKTKWIIGKGADFLKSAFLSKYGEGYGEKREYKLDELVTREDVTWENAKIKADYSYFKKENVAFEESFRVSLKDSLFYQRKASSEAAELHAKQRAEDEKKQKQYDKI